VAEGGMKITLYNVNNIDYENPAIEFLNYWFFKTMPHEFAHILHQTKPYPRDFNEISAADYQSESWVNIDDKDPNNHLKMGFISDYASRETQEDFVELIANYITHDQAWWDAQLKTAGDTGKSKITAKFDMVRDWLKSAWEIDIEQLRDIVQRRSANVTRLDLQSLN
jgi:substrate import-associated zinc metallohydrolase lipoprotein